MSLEEKLIYKTDMKQSGVSLYIRLFLFLIFSQKVPDVRNRCTLNTELHIKKGRIIKD